MYHPKIISDTVARFEKAFEVQLVEYTVEEVMEWTDHLDSIWDANKEEPVRTLTTEEQAFVTNELLMTKASYEYWAERYCNTPDAPIWMGDFGFKPLGDVRVGDTVIGWAKTPVLGRRPHLERPAPRRKFTTTDQLVRSRVLAKTSRMAPVIRVLMESGRVLFCTADHNWSNGLSAGRAHTPWVHAIPGATLRRVIDPIDVSGIDPRLGGWLGGIYDGEGSWTSIAQCPVANPLVHATIGEALQALGIPFSVSKEGNRFNLNGGRQGLLRFLLAAQPKKRTYWERSLLSSVHGTPDRVASIEPVGIREVVSMQTESGNYVAWGYASKNCWINVKGVEVRRLYPLWESQRLILFEIGRLQLGALSGTHFEGLLIALLKARQLGGSTLSESLIAHRVTTQDNQLGLIAADVPQQSAFMFDMLERIYLALPWWLRPKVTEWTKNDEIKFDGGSNVWVGSGKSTRGATGDRGQLGRGRTVGVMHLSELSTWEDTQQLEASLFPTLHPTPKLLGVLESTGRGRGNWWHKQWQAAREGRSRFTPVFIPWYAEQGQYSTPAPVGWSPSKSTVAHAKKAEEVGPRWLRRTVSLTREQLYWYETRRAQAKALGQDDERAFLENYCADDEEAFQFSGRSVVPFAVLTRVEEQMRGLWGCFEVGRASEIERMRAETLEDLDLRVPAGWSIVRTTKPSRGDDLTDWYGKLLVWQLPKLGRLYVVSVDVSDGLGLDRSVIEVTAVGTVEHPDEQVAQFVSASIDPVELAPIIEVIGKLYTGSDEMPAVVAIEINGHGLATQSELQKHLGYENLYIWRVEDAADPGKSLTTRVGWVTSSRSRPILLSRYFKKLKSLDPNTGLPDYLVNSPITLAELRDFIIPPGGVLLADAQADPSNPSAHDDTILAGAIGLYVAQTMQEDMGETTDDRRRRKAEEIARKLSVEQRSGIRVTARNTDCTQDELEEGEVDQ